MIERIFNKWLLQRKPFLTKKIRDGDLDGRIQAGNFRKLWVWKSTENSNVWKEIRDCSV